MTGWLVVNGFLRSDKFDDLYALLMAAFRARGVALERLPGTAFATPLDLPPLPGLSSAARPDFLLFWDKDVALAQRLEACGIPVFNPSSAIAACDSKLQTALALSRNGVPAPRTILAPKTFEGVGYSDTAFLHHAADALGLPFVVKEAFGSFGQQVHLVRSLNESEALLRDLGHRDFVMQEFVASSSGRDLRVNVVGGEAVASMRRWSETDFRSNVTLGAHMAPAVPTPAQRDAALAACRAVGAEFAGVDILYGPDDAPLVCEVNSNPHFRSTLDCTGVNLADAIAEHVLQEVTC